MDDTDWEQFIEECARQLQSEGAYVQVIRLGGAGDKGRDVCGYTVLPPTDGTWDLYQAKHYEGTLSPSGFTSDLAKFLWSVFSRDYSRPRHYFVCALRVGSSLHDYILKPDSMRAWILKEWKEKDGRFPKFSQRLTTPLEEFITSFPFDIFRRSSPADLLSIHRRTPALHWQRFGILEKRGPNPAVPTQLDPTEQKYVEALLAAYGENTGEAISTMGAIPPEHQAHFRIQRRLFYSAEGLNRFSRDKLPGAFDELLDQIEVGVGSVVFAPHSDGLSRLQKTLLAANTLPITSTPLSARLQAGDLQGGCHHLANQERFHWVKPE